MLAPFMFERKIMKPEKDQMEQEVEVVVLRDYWLEPKADGTENRVKAGSVVSVPINAAFDGIEAGMLKRVKD